nr:hypothetical protein [Tanacetum cinerariifolium]
KKENHSKDPFGIYSLLNKQKASNGDDGPSVQSLEFHPGYTPPANAENVQEEPSLSRAVPLRDTSESACSGHFKKFDAPRTGGSILNLMEEL